MTDETQPPLRDPEPHEVGRWIATWVRDKQGSDDPADLEIRFVARMLASRFPTGTPEEKRTFLLGMGLTLVGIMPMQQRVYDEGGEAQSVKVYGVTISHADKAYEIGSIPFDDREQAAEAYDGDHYKIFIVTPSLEWACRIGNSLFEDNDQGRFTVAKIHALEAEAEERRRAADEPPADPDLSLPDDQQ